MFNQAFVNTKIYFQISDFDVALSLRRRDRFSRKKWNHRKQIKVEVELNQEKINSINGAYEKWLQYRKRVALESVSTKNKRELIKLASKRRWFFNSKYPKQRTLIEVITNNLERRGVIDDKEDNNKTCWVDLKIGCPTSTE